LGIAALEDKIVQQAVAKILNQIHEVEADILFLFLYDPSDISSLRTDISAFRWQRTRQATNHAR
jgi:hypothetical protein